MTDQSLTTPDLSSILTELAAREPIFHRWEHLEGRTPTPLGQAHTIPPARLNQLYAKLPDYRALVTQHDPSGKFRNQFIDTNIFGA